MYRKFVLCLVGGVVYRYTHLSHFEGLTLPILMGTPLFSGAKDIVFYIFQTRIDFSFHSKKIQRKIAILERPFLCVILRVFDLRIISKRRSSAHNIPLSYSESIYLYKQTWCTIIPIPTRTTIHMHTPTHTRTRTKRLPYNLHPKHTMHISTVSQEQQET